MHEQIAVLRVEMQKRARDQPLEQFVAITGLEDLIERVRLALAATAEGNREKVQVVIAEHDDGVVGEGAHVAQDLQRARPAVDQVADEPETIAVGREIQPGNERAQLSAAALDIADRIAAHCTIPGMASRNGAMGASNSAPSSPIIW